MGSRKRSAQQKKIAEFRAQLGGLDDLYGRERRSQDKLSERREAARRERGCERKQRYATRADALEAIELCAEHGTRGLSCYRCEYCHGWHLTSHPHSQGR